MEKSFEELKIENEMLRREIKISREAAEITSDFVVKQFEQTEQMLHRFQIADAERQAVLNAATQLSIIATDLDGTIQLFNRGASTLLGYKSSEMVGKINILSLHLPDELENYGKKISNVVESSPTGMDVFTQYVKQQLTQGMEWLYKCKDNTLLQVNLSITGLHDSGGRMRGYLFTAMDLSAHKQLEYELRTARDEAESANASKGDFLARMSHEIRTPMNGILGMTYLLQKTELNERQRNLADNVLNSANTLLRLLNDILDFSKIDAGRLELESIPFCIEDVFNNVSSVIGGQAEEKGIEFLFHVDPQVPFNLVGDPLRLGQILLNLAGNAVKFTEHGEIVISISVEERLENTIMLRFSVRDTGVGLQPEQIQYLFTAFSQADDSITRQYGGTGLGLAICKELAELMGGEIWIKSEPDVGSDFHFTASFSIAEESVHSTTERSGYLSGLRALIVDDNQAARRALYSILTSFNMEADTVNDGHSAIARLEQAAREETFYDIVLLDWMMPGIDGIETARRIKANAALAKVPALLMVTANGREDALSEAEKVGMDSFLLKPVYGSVMYDTLLQVLGKAVAGSRSTTKPDDALLQLQESEGANVLLVDDNTINQEVGMAFLEDAGMVVTIANNGYECLDALEKKPFDLIFMDVQMPVMDGLETTRRIRQDDRFMDLPIIAMTAHAMHGDRDKSIAAGMNEHINKPIDPVVLYRALHDWIPGKHNTTHKPQNTAADHSPNKRSAEHTEIPQLSGIDPKEALSHLNNDSQLFLRMLRDFHANFATLPADIDKLAVLGDWRKIGESIHTVKGVAGYIGALRLLENAKEVESALAQGEQEVAIQRLPLFINALEEVLSSLLLLPDPPQNVLDRTSDTNVDQSTVAEKIHGLIAHLESGELEAEDIFSEIKDMIAGQGYEKILANIAECIDDIEYQQAAQSAQELLKQLSSPNDSAIHADQY